MTKRKLKLGILLDTFDIPAWAYNALEMIITADYAVFSLIVLNDRNGVHVSKLNNILKNWHKIIYHLCNKIDEKLDRREPNAFSLRNLQKILKDVPILKVKPIRRMDSEYIRPLDIQKIKEAGLDILIKMGFGNLRGDILTTSKYGTWAYHHGDNRINQGGPPGFWEVVEKWAGTGSSLQAVGEDFPRSKILYRSEYFTHPFSPARNRSHYFWASSSFLQRQISLLCRLGEERFRTEIERLNPELTFYDHRGYKTPSNLLALKLFAKLLARVVFRIYQKALYLDQWFLMFDISRDLPTTLHKFKELLPPKSSFWTDPHVIWTNGKYYIFIEEYIYRKKKGHISVIEMDEMGNWRGPNRVLEKDYHLSYPFVFEWTGKYFMVPETAENRTIDLYECVEFPHQWKFKTNLMKNIKAVDTTLFHYNGRWWLFTGMAENEGSFPLVELFLFSSSDLFAKEWDSHPLNPIVSDIKKSRPAGRLFARNGKIFRPSQDCSIFYGYGFDLNEILLLSETEYSERETVSVRPNWNKKVQATHTFTNEGQLTIIDAFIRRRRFF
jgi:hypothetical protein